MSERKAGWYKRLDNAIGLETEEYLMWQYRGIVCKQKLLQHTAPIPRARSLVPVGNVIQQLSLPLRFS